jgi:hypothetical protein
MKGIKHMRLIGTLGCLALLVVALNAQTPTRMDVNRVNSAAQLGPDGKVLASQLPASVSGGASQTAQLLDWAFTRVSNTRLQFGANCLPASPCNVAIGGKVSSFTDGPYTINVSGAVSGSICVYITPTSTLTVGLGTGLTPSNVTGSNALAFVAGVTSCPQDAAWIAKWDIANGVFSPSGYQYASYFSYKPSPIAGSGIQIVAGQRDTIQIDTGSVLRKFTCTGGPSASLPSGATQGDICWDFTPATPAKYVCANAAGCAAAGDWKAF